MGTVSVRYCGHGYILRDDSIAIHCGVVGNMQASHVCAPGSIPGDGVFFEYKIKGREREGDR